MSSTRLKSPSPSRQRGAVLVIGLAVLGVLLLLAAAAVTIANTQFKVSGNMQYHNIAFANAESALAVAENWLNANYASSAFATGATQPGIYPANAAINPLTMQWNDSTSIKVDGDGAQRYVIELYMPERTPPTSSLAQCNTYGMTAPCPKVNLYRVSARGAGALGATKIVQTIYAVRTN